MSKKKIWVPWAYLGLGTLYTFSFDSLAGVVKFRGNTQGFYRGLCEGMGYSGVVFTTCDGKIKMVTVKCQNGKGDWVHGADFMRRWALLYAGRRLFLGNEEEIP